jgi:hypothetical protein
MARDTAHLPHAGGPATSSPGLPPNDTTDVVTVGQVAWAIAGPWFASFVVHTILLAGLGFLTWTISGSGSPRPIAAQIHEAVELQELHDVATEPIEFDAPSETTSPATAPAAARALSDLTPPPLAVDAGSLDVATTRPSAFVSASAHYGLDDLSAFTGATPGTGTDEDRSSVTFYGIRATGCRFVFVLDRSGSMQGSKWLDACQELVRTIGSMREDQEYYVFLFADGWWAMWDRQGKEIELVPATAANVRGTVEWLSQQYPMGNTLPERAMQRALRLEPDAVFLLSDGEIQDDTLGMLRRNNRMLLKGDGRQARVIINTIAFHSVIGAPLLEQIAAENGGSFAFIE